MQGKEENTKKTRSDAAKYKSNDQTNKQFENSLMQKKIQTMNEKITNLWEKSQTQEKQTGIMKQQIALMKDQMSEMRNKIKQLQQKVQQYKKQRDKYKKELEQALQELATSKKELQNSKKEVIEAKNQIQIIEYQAQVKSRWQSRKQQQRNKKRIQAENRELDLKNKNQSLEIEKKTANQKISEQQRKIGRLTFQVYSLDMSIKDYQKQIDLLNAQFKNNKKQIQSLNQEIDKKDKRKIQKLQELHNYFINMVNDLRLKEEIENDIKNYFSKQNIKIIDKWIEDTNPTQVFDRVIKQMFSEGDFYFISSDIFSLAYSYYKDKSQQSVRQLFNQVKLQSTKDNYYQDHKFKRITKHHIKQSFGFSRVTSEQSGNSQINSSAEKNIPRKMSQGSQYQKDENKQMNSYLKLNEEKQMLIKKIKRSQESIKELKNQYKRLCGQHNANIVGEAKRKYNDNPGWLWKIIQSHFWSQQFQLQHMDVLEQIYKHCHQEDKKSLHELCKQTILQAKNDKEKKQTQVVRASLEHVNIAKKIVLESKEKDEL